MEKRLFIADANLPLNLYRYAKVARECRFFLSLVSKRVVMLNLARFGYCSATPRE